MTIIGTTSLVHNFSVVLVMLNYQHHQVLDKLHTAQVEHTELTNTNAHTTQQNNTLFQTVRGVTHLQISASNPHRPKM